MNSFSFLKVAQELDNVEETGVSFEGKTNNWGTETEVKSVVDEIDKCKNLIYLNLEGNTLGVEAARAIGKALEKHPEFKIALWKDLFTSRLKTEIPEALKLMGQGIIAAGANLTVLDCSDNALGPNGMVGLVELLKSRASYSLQELKLNNCGLGIAGGKMLAEALLTCHKNSCEAGTPLSLKVFIAGRNRLENEGAKALAKVFLALKTLEEIAMPQNGIYHDGISALSIGFKENENMRILNLNDNTITARGANSLADAFFSMQKLKEINFGDCLLKTKGMLLLADALQDQHKVLEVVNFECNEIGPDGGLAVISAMQNKPIIKSIILGGNNFGYEGRERIKEIINSNNKADVLGSLSEDESEAESEGEDDEEAEEVSNNSEVAEEDTEGEVEDDEDGDIFVVDKPANSTVDETYKSFDGSFLSKDSSSILFTGEEERPNTVETFCNTPNPSLEMFTSLEESNKLEAFRSYLKESKDEDYLIKLVFTILKCSALAKVSTEALEVTFGLYKDAFDYAIETSQLTRVRTFFLIQLGLLKCEDKTFKPIYNLQATRYALKQAVDKKTFPDDIQSTFNLFLEKFS